MFAIACDRNVPLTQAGAFLELDLPRPAPGPRDLLVRVRAVSVNPIDTKVRRSFGEGIPEPRILGWDASGVVEAVGAEVDSFQPGDEVFYAGSILRDGAQAALHLVDERLAAIRPKSLSFAEAASLPLTALTAWEALFEQLGLSGEGLSRDQHLLVIGAAGGVGSIALQLATSLACMQVIATASRPESAAWCERFGAQRVVDHATPLVSQLRDFDCSEVDAILCLAPPDPYMQTMADLIRPFGRICCVVDPTDQQPLPMQLLKPKSAVFAWEFMFARSTHATPDMAEQGRILARVAEQVDAGVLRHTVSDHLGVLSAERLAEAHRRLESGHTMGKLVLEMP